MTKQQIRKSLERYGDFLNINQVSEFIGVHRGTARQMLCGLDYIPNGKEKLYYKDDIADAIYRKVRNE